MARSVAGTERTAVAPAPVEAETFDLLKELTRNGYVPDTSEIETSGIRLRHDSAPDLVLHADGRIEVPLGQRRKSAGRARLPGVGRGMSWRRTIPILLLLVMLWMFSAWLTAVILESM